MTKAREAPNYKDFFYERGNLVLYTVKDDKWCGPAEIEAVDDCNVILKKYNSNL